MTDGVLLVMIMPVKSCKHGYILRWPIDSLLRWGGVEWMCRQSALLQPHRTGGHIRNGVGGGRSGNPLELCLPGSPSWGKPYPGTARIPNCFFFDYLPLS